MLEGYDFVRQNGGAIVLQKGILEDAEVYKGKSLPTFSYYCSTAAEKILEKYGLEVNCCNELDLVRTNNKYIQLKRSLFSVFGTCIELDHSELILNPEYVEKVITLFEKALPEIR